MLRLVKFVTPKKNSNGPSFFFVIDYASALNGVKTVFCTIPHMHGWADAFPCFLKQCKKQKVEHFVKVSFLRPTHSFKGVAETARQYRQNVPFVAFHGTCDDIAQKCENTCPVRSMPSPAPFAYKYIENRAIAKHPAVPNGK